MELHRSGLFAGALLLAIVGAGPSKADTVGPWTVVPYKDDGKFLHCIMARAETSVPAPAITLGTDHVGFVLISKAWKLQAGQTLKAKLTAGSRSEDFDAVVAEPTVVAIALTGRDAMLAAVRSASSVTVTLPMGTFNPPFDGAAAAFAKLDECLATATKGAGGAPPPGKPGNPQQPPKRISDAAYAIMRADCEQDQDKDRQLSGCTAVIESGREEAQVLAIAYSNRGFAYSGKADWDHAIADFTQSIQLNPGWVNAHYGRGDAYFQKSDFAHAITDYSDAIRLTPNDASLYRSRGLARFRGRDAGGAIDDYTAALKLTPNDAALLSARADVYASTGDNRRAIADYDAALRIDPTLQSAIDGRAKLRGGAAPAQPSAPAGITFTAVPANVSIEQYTAFIRSALRSSPKTEVDKDGNFIAYPSRQTRTMLIVRKSEGTIDENVSKFTAGLRSGCKTYGPNEVIKSAQSGAVTARRTRMTCKIDDTDMIYDDVYVTDGANLHVFATFGADQSRSEVDRISSRIFDGLGKLYQ